MAQKDAILPTLPVKLSLPLEFQQDLFNEVRSEDELVILARGLGLLRLVTNLLHSYDAVGNNFVIIIGAEERENSWIGEALAHQAALSRSAKCRGLTQVTTDSMTVGTREQLYSRGGIFTITSRILVVDFLSGLLSPATISGIISLHSDRIVATSLEAFILRIYRQKNKVGFLKAFSDNPESFTTGFAPLQTMMRNLFLRKPSLWPRFQITVAKSLEGKKKAEVIELEVPMSEAMRDIQNAVLECVEVSISELKKANSGLEMDDWNIDSALHRNFDSMIRRQLDPVWHRTSFRSRQIVRDLTILRTILHYLLAMDCVAFNKYLDTVLAASQPPPGSTRHNQSPWLFLDAAHTIFETARRRVYTGKSHMDAGYVDRSLPENIQPVLEENPKWAVLSEVLDEIQQDSASNISSLDDSNGTCLIMASDQMTCHQIREYLQTMNTSISGTGRTSRDAVNVEEPFRHGPSAELMLRRKLRNYLGWKKDFAKVSTSLFSENEKSINGQHQDTRLSSKRGPPNKRRRIRGGGSTGPKSEVSTTRLAGDRDAHIASLLADLEPSHEEQEEKPEIAFDPLHNMDEFFELYEMKDIILIHPYDGDKDDLLLEETKPKYVVMYEPDAAFIRRVEVYRSSHTDRDIRVYFLYYGGSVEEQRYLSAVRREKESFTKLIRERASMAVTLTTDAIDDPQESFLRTVNTRIAGGGRLAATSAQPRVVVDVREFRSSLPSLLHGRSMEVIPCTLTVGDYVLSTDICIERKSIKDLISSFKDGRLYDQAETMLRFYKWPMLLIEFDMNKSFTLEPFADLTQTGTSSIASLNPNASTDLQSKLVLLTLAFPRLRIIWSSSPYQTAEIFEELKKQQEEPDPLKAVQFGLDEDDDSPEQTFSQVPQDMLRTIPGVTAKNMGALTLELENIQSLANMSEDSIEPLVGIETARQIHRFFNRSVFDD